MTDPIISKWESNRRYADWCGPDCIVSIPASELYHILDRSSDFHREAEIAKAERNREHVTAHQKAMELVRQAEDGRQYWMHAALGRETEGDARDEELLRVVRTMTGFRTALAEIADVPNDDKHDVTDCTGIARAALEVAQ